MVTICCTAKLIRKLDFPVGSSIPEPTTALGNWYANILFFYRRRFLLFVSERSRLAVITPSREIRSVASHLRDYLSILLEYLNVKPEWIEAEIRQMASVCYAATNSRSILGTMNDYKFQISAILERTFDLNEAEIAVYLSNTPIGSLQYKFTNEETLELLRRKYQGG